MFQPSTVALTVALSPETGHFGGEVCNKKNTNEALVPVGGIAQLTASARNTLQARIILLITGSGVRVPHGSPKTPCKFKYFLDRRPERSFRDPPTVAVTVALRSKSGSEPTREIATSFQGSG